MNLNHFYHYYKSKSGGVSISNLLKASEDFTSSLDWLKKPDTAAPTITGGVTDPNGGTDAQRVNFTANRQSRVQQSVTLSASTQYTFSVYARVNTGTDQFRLRNVTLGEAEPKTATTSWTRFEYTFTTTTGGVYELSIQNTENVVANIEFFGAMLNVGSSAKDYVKVDPSTGGSAPDAAYSGFGDVFGGVTAYYSLRQFTEAETLNAIRVRRSSDDTEQDIGFDANGDLDSTALLAFVNEDVDTYTSDFSSTEDLGEANGTGAAAQSIGGVDDAYKFTLSGGSAFHQALKVTNSDVGDFSEEVGTLTFDYYLPSGQTTDNINAGFSSGSVMVGSVTDAWQSVSLSITSFGNGTLFFRPRNGTSSTYNGDDDVFYLKNIVVTQTTADGAVTTWYDQTGNGNNATNATESEQPLVVSAGTLVEENSKAAIDFDADDDFLQTSFAAGVTDNWFVAGVQKANNLSGIKYSYGGRDGSGDGPLVYTNNDTLNARVVGTTITQSPLGTDPFLYIQELSATNNTHNLYFNGVLADSEAASSINTTTNIRIGKAAYVDSGVLDGLLQELIIFDSDQSSNRTGIETNINDHFDIYTP